MKILHHSIVSLIIVFCFVAAVEAGPQGHPGQYERADIEVGSRLYANQCVPCHGPNGDMINGIDLRRGLFKTAFTDEDLTRVLRTGRPDSGMPAFALLQPQEVSGIIAFIRAGFDASTSIKLGDAARGQDLFSGKGGCGSCHRINGRGPRQASDLSDIGAIRSPASLQRTLLDPNRNLIPANRNVVAVMRDGKTIRGRRLNEDTYTVQLIDDQERLVSLTKIDLRSLQIVPTSAMPSYEKTLSPDEISDLIAYLLTLKGL
jgi:putative heme-binding domain-containing protein